MDGLRYAYEMDEGRIEVVDNPLDM
jgi:hypothetical protein